MHLETPAGKAAAAPVLADLVKQGRHRARSPSATAPPGARRRASCARRCASCAIDVPVVMVSESGASVYSASDVGARGVPRPRRHRARRDLDRAPAAGSARRAGEDRSEEHRRRAVPARRLAARAQEEPRRGGRFVREPGRREPQHGVGAPARRTCRGSGRRWRAPSSSTARKDGAVPLAATSCSRCRASRRRRSSRRRASCACRAARNPLDNTGVHPERYAALERLAAQLGVGTVGDLLGRGRRAGEGGDATLRDEVGAFTFDDIVRELEKPGRDPRETFVPFAFREDVHDARGPAAGDGLPRHRHQRHQLRRVRRHRRPPGRPGPHLAARRPLREGPARGGQRRAIASACASSR